MRKIIFATGNKEKMKEIRQIMEDCPVEIFSMKEAGYVCDAEENGTFPIFFSFPIYFYVLIKKSDFPTIYLSAFYVHISDYLYAL